MTTCNDNEGTLLFPTRMIAIGFADSARSVMPQCEGCPLLKSYLEKKGMVFLWKETDFLWRICLEGGLRAKKYPGSSYWYVLDAHGNEIAFVNTRRNIVPVGYVRRQIDVRFEPHGNHEACVALYDDVIFQGSADESMYFLATYFPGWKCPCVYAEITQEYFESARSDETKGAEQGKSLILKVAGDLKGHFPKHECGYILLQKNNDF